MSQVPYNTHSTWSWPEEATRGLSVDEDTHLPGAFGVEETLEPKIQDPAGQGEAHSHDPREKTLPKSHRYYAPRTCRICLEVVQPSFEPLEGVSSIFNPAPKVQYISEDPGSGRLIRPCHCKGTGRYVHEGCLQEWRHADTRYGRRK